MFLSMMIPKSCKKLSFPRHSLDCLRSPDHPYLLAWRRQRRPIGYQHVRGGLQRLHRRKKLRLTRPLAVPPHAREVLLEVGVVLLVALAEGEERHVVVCVLLHVRDDALAVRHVVDLGVVELVGERAVEAVAVAPRLADLREGQVLQLLVEDRPVVELLAEFLYRNCYAHRRRLVLFLAQCIFLSLDTMLVAYFAQAACGQSLVDI